MALGDISIYTKDNGFGYQGDVDFLVLTGATVPQILSGELVTKTLGSGSFVSALGSGTAALNYPIMGQATGNTPIVGVAATTSNETTSGTVNGSVSVLPADADVTYLVSTLQTTAFFGNPSSGIALQQLQYNTNVGARVAMNRIGGAGASQLGGTYYIQSTDLTSGALVVEELDIQKFPGKVRFSIRKGASYRA